MNRAACTTPTKLVDHHGTESRDHDTTNVPATPRTATANRKDPGPASETFRERVERLNLEMDNLRIASGTRSSAASYKLKDDDEGRDGRDGVRVVPSAASDTKNLRKLGDAFDFTPEVRLRLLVV